MKDILIDELIKCIHYLEWNIKIMDTPSPYGKAIRLLPNWIDKEEEDYRELYITSKPCPLGSDRVVYKLLIGEDKLVDSLSEAIDYIEGYFNLEEV